MLYMLKGQKKGHCAWSTFHKGKGALAEAGEVDEGQGFKGLCTQSRNIRIRPE